MYIHSATGFYKIVIVLPLLFIFSCNRENCVHETDLGTPQHILDHYTMIWNDEFEGTTIDPSKWNYRAEGTKRHYAVVSRNTIALDSKGNVMIMVKKDDKGNYLVGQLGTQGLFETKYGYFECRAKMNRSLGPHVAFWLQSPTIANVGNTYENGTEIDIFEYHRKNPGTVYHNLHWDGYGYDHKTYGINIPYPEIDEGFHTIGLEWTENEYIFYVNGQETWRTDTAISRRSQYMILSTELTGWGGDPEKGQFPDTVWFDYVRVYKPK